ncbi:hypothetical protein ASPBRDRAFT_58302 [Aspergillus brasiliensis CBS 101740]|uniref:Ketoreductase (KR) domain-containing protein n=1 Tax=Aspergillus brasiliensis (strain CBS 101740 / IMI 381727 / IBT 21946) TaxID=767769 RepID=A0A1L9U9B6_ASPBC|nr:hypothetical protein ASPBRDRAFT_58302 [Aspergillus brasiliensis CBS 101740]
MAYLLHGSALVTRAGSALVDIDPLNLRKVSESLKHMSSYVELLTSAVDVTDQVHVDSAVQKAAAEFGRVDIGSIVKDWQPTIDINQTGVWLLQRALIQQMLTQKSRGTRVGRGVIVNVCSSLGITASATGMPFPAYTSSKHGEVESTPVGRVANMEEVTDSILFLASPMSSLVYGAGLVVDGDMDYDADIFGF